MKKKILIAEDNRDLVTLLKTYLESKDYEVLTAFDGIETLELVKEDKPDLILLDIMMPRMDGYTTLKELRGNRKTRDVPVIIITAKGQMRDIVEMEGVSDYIVKPFEYEDLLQRIKQIL